LKFKCLRCQRDFTTLSENDKDKNFAFSHIILGKMKCPYCGASNGHLDNYKKIGNKKTTKRGYAGWGSGERQAPNISLHSDCRKRLFGNVTSGFRVVCKGCPSFFNCWSGNVDDGMASTPIKEEKIIPAKKDIVKRTVDDYTAKLKKYMKSIDFTIYEKDDKRYIKHANTIWKIGKEDSEVIINDTWNTNKTREIEKTLNKLKIDKKVFVRFFKYEINK